MKICVLFKASLSRLIAANTAIQAMSHAKLTLTMAAEACTLKISLIL